MTKESIVDRLKRLAAKHDSASNGKDEPMQSEWEEEDTPTHADEGYEFDDDSDGDEDYEDGQSDSEDSDIPDASHRDYDLPVPAVAGVVGQTVAALGRTDFDGLANKVADRVIAKLRDALNHLPS